MPTLRQSLATYALTIVTWQRRRILQTDRNASLAIATLFHHRDAGHFSLHAFVVMPDHLHVLVTPAIDQATARCAQLIKGATSHAIGRPSAGKLWQDGYFDHRIRSLEDFGHQKSYIANNPTRADFPHVHTHPYYVERLDGLPPQFSPLTVPEMNTNR